MAGSPQASIPPSGTSKLFSRNKSSERGASVTRESLARDLAAFRKTGGKIEVLGNNRTLSPSEEREQRNRRAAQAAAARTRARSET